jgi:hypothetical protein
MSFVLDGTTLPDPNSYNEEPEVIGDYVTTLGGGKRRNIKAKKNTYTLGWTNLTADEVDTITGIDSKNTTVSFVNSDLSINTTVHTDISGKALTPGVGVYLYTLTLTLTES